MEWAEAHGIVPGRVVMAGKRVIRVNQPFLPHREGFRGQERLKNGDWGREKLVAVGLYHPDVTPYDEVPDA
jgi:hypothetical protein